MKKPFRGWVRSVIAVALGFAMAFCVAACDLFPSSQGGDDGEPPAQTVTEREPIGEKDFLRADGELVKNAEGEEVYLRGVNAGGLFVTENWMNGFESSGPTAEIGIRTRDFRTISQVFVERFGLEGAKELWKAYQDAWWGEIDFQNCAAMGMNCIRLPFTYMTVDFDCVVSYDNAGDYDFTPLDNFVDKAASYGMYTILDMHGAYGSQNGQDHSGQTMDSQYEVGFYSDERMISLTEDLWSALAEHYKDNPAVAGYDVLNEPGEKAGLTEARHFAVFDRLYDAIRERDQRHMVIFESCWDGKDLPQPSEYGWENCMYSFHHYTSMAEGGQYVEHGYSWNQKITGVARENFGVPIQMGEFNNYNDPEQWVYCLGLLNNLNWHWESWTYKLNSSWSNSAWGIYDIPAVNKVNAHYDDFETILEKFEILRTTKDIHKVDLGGRTLESIMTEFCSAPAGTPLPPASYVLRDTVTNLPLYMSNGVPLRSPDPNAGQEFTVTETPEHDGAVYIGPARTNSVLTVENGALSLGTRTEAARFFPVETEYGYAFVSYVTCRYLCFGADGKLYANGVTPEDSAIFYCE